MAADFGPEAGFHGPWDFDVTDYYQAEMGGPLTLLLHLSRDR